MKSAYEKAMERMEAASGPTQKLNDDQKAAIAEIDKKYDAQSAETKLGFDAKIATAEPTEQLGLREEQANELQKIESRREHDKEQVWNSAKD